MIEKKSYVLNEFEQIYNIKMEIDQNISKHRLFLLSKEDAINTVFEKLGVLFRLILSASHNKVMEYIKEKVKTNAVNISEIDFIQESLKWICRWSSKYCAEQSENKVKISAEEIYELMGMAYSYEQFYRMWQLHNKQIVKFRQFGNKLEFTYCNEETYMVHVAYELGRRNGIGVFTMSEFMGALNQVYILGQLIERIMTEQASDLEESVKADVFLMGSFQYTEEANDIDLILIYSIANYDAMKRLKDVLAEAIYDTFNIPVHYTTLSENEYEEMYALRQEKQCVLFEYYHK